VTPIPNAPAVRAKSERGMIFPSRMKKRHWLGDRKTPIHELDGMAAHSL
jgi:hypothetical protein